MEKKMETSIGLRAYRLRVYFNPIPVYPRFYLLEGDYDPLLLTLNPTHT